MDFFVRKADLLVLNKAVMEPKDYISFQMGVINKSMQSEGGKGYTFEGRVKVDKLHVKIVRTTGDFLTWFGLIGGSIKSIKSLLAFFVLNYVKRDYFDKVMGKLFMVKKYAKGQAADDITNLAEEDKKHTKGDGFGHLKNIRFCSTKERHHYKQLKTEMRDSRIEGKSINHILQHMAKNRIPYDKAMSVWRIIFEFVISDFYCWPNCCLHNLVRCWCPVLARRDKKSTDYRYNRLFMNGIKRFFGEVDIVKVLQALRRSKLLLNALTHQKHRVMMSW